MEIQEALKILDQVCAVHQGVRADHVAMQQALQVLTEVAVSKEKVKPTDLKKESDGNK